jgi:CubicO group peptidase (beta-lactamase class C family)
LQLVERGTISLDEPVYQHLPELESLPLIKRGTSVETFTLCSPVKKITLRHLLLHTSGLSNHSTPLVSDYIASDCAKLEFPEDAPYIVKHFSIPLVFEPGEGFAYGYSIHWLQLLLTRVTGDFVRYIQEHIFNPLCMESSSYRPQGTARIWNRRLQMVERAGAKLIPTDDASQGLMCSMLDVGAILNDLISPSPKLLLKQEHIDLLFTGQFAPSSASMRDLRGDHENYAFCAGKPGNTSSPPAVNWSVGGLVAEGELPLSEMRKGTVTWEGMPNVLWAMNREKRLAMFFATQLIPVGDKKANELAVMFMRDAWKAFG